MIKQLMKSSKVMYKELLEFLNDSKYFTEYLDGFDLGIWDTTEGKVIKRNKNRVFYVDKTYLMLAIDLDNVGEFIEVDNEENPVSLSDIFQTWKEYGSISILRLKVSKSAVKLVKKELKKIPDIREIKEVDL